MKKFLKVSGILILIVAVVLAAGIGISSVFFPGQTTVVSNVVGIIISPFRTGVATFTNWVGSIYNYAYGYDTLKAENEELKLKIAEMEDQVRAGIISSEENKRLYELLGLREKRADFVFESATIVSKSASNWESTFTINRGTAHGVAVKNCVVTETGALVGVVAETGTNWAMVSTVIDSGLEMGGLIFRTNEAAILEGDFALMGEGKLKLTYLPENSEILSGDLILTSGRGGVYPSGLKVGTVDEVLYDASGMSRYAILTPVVDLGKLTQVFIIRAFDIVE